MRLQGWTSKCAFVLTSICLLACGSVKSGDGDADFTITVNPPTLTVPIAGSQTVALTIERTGDVGDVMLSASGLGANLSVTFDPNPVPAGATSSQATITVAGGTTPATTNITLTGTASALQHSASVSVTSTTITVTGTVRGNRSGVKVGLVGKQSVTSGAGGVFMFTDVTPPYDLYTFGDGGSSTAPTPTVFLFNGLTRPDPIVSAPSTFTFTPFFLCFITACPSSAISGTKTGSGTNTDPVVFAWTNGSFSGALASNGTLSGTVTWSSGNTNQGFLHALQLTRKPSGAPDTFLGYARSGQVTLTDGTPATINLGFSAVTSTATLTGTLNGPAGYPSPSITLYQQFGPTQAPLWQTSTTTTVDATFPLLSSSAGGAALYATTTLNNGTSTFVQPLTQTVAVNFTMPAAAVLSQPADAATGVTTSTHFTWTSAPSTINELNISTGSPTRAAYKIFTTASDVTIPVIPELALPANQTFSWSIVGYGPNASINEAAAANDLESVSSADYTGPAHAQTFTPGRSFTSAP